MRYLLILIVNLLFIYCPSAAAVDTGAEFRDTYRLIQGREYDSAINILNNMLQKLEEKDHIGEAYFTLGYTYNEIGQHLKAIQYYLKAADYYTKEDCLANTFENIGLIFKGFNQHRFAIYYFSKAIALEENNSVRIMKKLYSRSTSYRRSDQTNLALEDLLKAEEIAFESNQDVYRAKVYNQLGLLFKFRGEYSKAGSYYYQALQIAETRDVYHNYANLKKELGDTLAAESYFLKAIEVSGNTRLITTYIDLGELYYYWSKPEKADFYLKRALEIYRERGNAVFNHVKLFEILALADNDSQKAADYKDSAIIEYKNLGAELKQSNELFFGAIANEKTQNLEIKRAYKSRSRNYNTAFILIGILTIALTAWLIIKLRKGAKDRKITKAFERIQNIIYEE